MKQSYLNRRLLSAEYSISQYIHHCTIALYCLQTDYPSGLLYLQNTQLHLYIVQTCIDEILSIFYQNQPKPNAAISDYKSLLIFHSFISLTSLLFPLIPALIQYRTHKDIFLHTFQTVSALILLYVYLSHRAVPAHILYGLLINYCAFVL